VGNFLMLYNIIKQVGVYSSCTDVVQRPFPGFPSGFNLFSMVLSSFLFIKIVNIGETSKCLPKDFDI